MDSKKSEYMIQRNYVSTRRVIPYNEFVFEEDECILHSDEPVKVKEFIESLLNSLNIKVKNSAMSKYAGSSSSNGK